MARRGPEAFLVVFAMAGCGGGASGPPPLLQHEVTQPGALLGGDGKLREPGWARRELYAWDPTLVRDSSQLRMWDFFTVMSEAAAVNLTIADLGFARIASVGVVDFSTGVNHQASVLAAQGDAFSLSPALDGDAALTPAGSPAPAVAYHSAGGVTSVSVEIPESLLGPAAQASFTLTRAPSLEFLSLATPFSGDAHQFFFEQKIPGIAADGTLTLGGTTWNFSGATATMDWGRGQWPKMATWRWGGASGTAGAQTLAFNLGNGFGDDHAGTENLVIVDGTAHKLGRVMWTHDASDPTLDWSFTADDGSVTLTLHPVAKETGGLDFGTRYSHLFKAYGHYQGTIIADGASLTVDNLPGFAEEENLSW
jgi:Protein of unknown function (DUF2804)